MTGSSIPLEDKIPLLMHHDICKSREYILLHVAKREHLLDLIIEKYTGDTNISYLIQSFEQGNTRLAFTSLVTSSKLDTICKMINQAIDLEIKAKL
jgi:hypothetical protein